MASQEKGKALMMDADTKPKDYHDALAFLTRLKDLMGRKFVEFCCHFCEFMDKRIDRQTFFETKACLLLKEHPDLLTDMPQSLGSIDGWDQNLCENLRADLIRISASAPSNSSTQSEPKTRCPSKNSGIEGTSGQVATMQESVSSGNENLNRKVAVRKPPTGEYWRPLQWQMQQYEQQHWDWYLQQYYVQRQSGNAPRQLPVAMQQNVWRGDEHLSREIQERELAQEESNTSSVPVTMQQNESRGDEHSNREIQEQELAQQEPNTSSVPVAMQQNVSRGDEHLDGEILEQELPEGGEYWQQQGLSYVQQWYAPQQLYVLQQWYAPQQPYVQQQRQAHTPQQYYVQPQWYAPDQLYVQQQQQQQQQAHTPQQSYVQPQWYTPDQLYVQQQQQQQQQAHTPQQSYGQPQWYAPHQLYVQPPPPQQQYLQPRAMPQWYMLPQFHSQPRWWYVNTSPRTKKD